MVWDLVLTAVAGLVLGLVASRFAALAGFVLLVLWLLGRAVPQEFVESAATFVGNFVAPGAELLFVAMLLLGVGSGRERGTESE